MSFRKRSPIYYGDSPIIVDVSVSSSGARTLVAESSADFFIHHPIPDDEFTLTEEMQAGVCLKELPCSDLIGSADPLDHHIDTGVILDALTPPEPSNVQND